MDIRTQDPNEILRRVFVEQERVVDRIERCCQRKAIHFAVEGLLAAALASSAAVAIASDYQAVAELFRFLQEPDVPGVQDVEETVGEHYCPAGQALNVEFTGHHTRATDRIQRSVIALGM